MCVPFLLPLLLKQCALPWVSQVEIRSCASCVLWRFEGFGGDYTDCLQWGCREEFLLKEEERKEMLRRPGQGHRLIIPGQLLKRGKYPKETTPWVSWLLLQPKLSFSLSGLKWNISAIGSERTRQPGMMGGWPSSHQDGPLTEDFKCSLKLYHCKRAQGLGIPRMCVRRRCPVMTGWSSELDFSWL